MSEQTLSPKLQTATASLTPAPSGILQRKCACGNHTVAGGECVECGKEKNNLQRKASNHNALGASHSLLHASIIQAKLVIGASNNPLEQEADRVADQVLALPTHPAVSGAPSHIQRFARQLTEQAETAPPSVDRVLGSSGRPLDPALRQDMEQRFGHDFSRVRVHSGSAAEQSAQDVRANAYTAGHNIVFGAGRFAPGTHEGRCLLAHELTHVVQQSGADGIRGRTNVKRGLSPIVSPIVPADPTHEQNRPLTIGQNDTVEGQAEAASAAIDQGQRVGLSPVASLGLARQPDAGAPPAAAPAAASNPLVQELQTLIASATWPEIRKRVYPKESAAGVQRAKSRHAGKQPDMAGLGKLTTLDHFAAAVHTIQNNWATFAKADDRVAELGKVANDELKGADVPGFLRVNKEPMMPKGYFEPAAWRFAINETLVSAGTLSNDDAAELANTTLHESRHAEQNFLSARYSAGVNGKKAKALAAEQGIPEKPIAEQAVAKKFDKSTDPATVAFGQKMYQADITDGPKNQAISDEVTTAITDLDTKRNDCQTALDALKATATPKTIADASAKRDALKAQIAIVEQKYTGYRNIPYEADSHEVGDAEEQAFKGWP